MVAATGVGQTELQHDSQGAMILQLEYASLSCSQ